MGRKQDAEQETKRPGWRAGLRYGLVAAALLIAAVGALYVYGRVDQFLAGDPRFRLPEPSGDAGESPALQVEGLVHTPRAKIVNAFAADFGRSLYLLPLAERRRSLLAIDWVRDATVARLWPDRVAVKIVERQPVAFVQLPQERAGPLPTFRAALIDVEGVILEQPARAQFALPVLAGIREEQSQSMRRVRVAAALRLVQELGALAGQISEIDVSEPDDIRVVQQAEGRVVLLMLGNRNFLSRLQNFMSHYQEIQRRLPDAAAFDLRLDDRITAVGEGKRGG